MKTKVMALRVESEKGAWQGYGNKLLAGQIIINNIRRIIKLIALHCDPLKSFNVFGEATGVARCPCPSNLNEDTCISQQHLRNATRLVWRETFENPPSLPTTILITSETDP